MHYKAVSGFVVCLYLFGVGGGEEGLVGRMSVCLLYEAL